MSTFLGICIAFLGACIAWAQWNLGRQKLVLDLFEKRFQAFLDFRVIASHAMQTGKLPDRGLPNELVARGRFLFGAEIVNAFIEMHRLSVMLETNDPMAFQNIQQHFDRTLPLFEPYLRMDQKLPEGPVAKVKRLWARRPTGE